MISFSDKVPAYMLGKYQLISTVGFTALFSLVFLLFSIPFSSNFWFTLGGSQAFGYTVAFFLVSLAIVILSKMQMYKMRFAPNFTIGQMVAWDAGEAILIGLLYAFLTVEGNEYGIIDTEGMPFMMIFGGAMVYIVIALGAPYAICALYFMVNERDNTIRMYNMSSVVTDEAAPAGEDRMITLYDQSGAPKFIIKQSSLYFIESDDNYIQAWYMDSAGQMKQYMLRCRLKTVEESFVGSDLIRCHRKYIVNISRVRMISSRKEGYFIDMDIDSIPPIPISKTYEETILSRFNSR